MSKKTTTKRTIAEKQAILKEKAGLQRKKLIDDFIANYDELIGSENHPEFMDPLSLIDAAKELGQTQGNRNNLFPKGPPKETPKGYSDAELYLEGLEKELNSSPDESQHCPNWDTFLNANWMCFENYIDNWHVGIQGKADSCNGWTVADGMLTFFFAKYDFENSSEANGRAVLLWNDIRFKIDRSNLPSVRHAWMLGKYKGDGSIWEVISDSIGSFLHTTIENIISIQRIADRADVAYLQASPFPIRVNTTNERQLRDFGQIFTNSWSRKGNGYFLYSDETERFTIGKETKDQNLIRFLRKWISIVGPVGLEFSPPANFKTNVGTWAAALENAVIHDDGSASKINHSVALVGFQKLHDELHFIVRNHYGVEWGYYGQALLPSSYILNPERHVTLVALTLT